MLSLGKKFINRKSLNSEEKSQLSEAMIYIKAVKDENRRNGVDDYEIDTLFGQLFFLWCDLQPSAELSRTPNVARISNKPYPSPSRLNR